MAIKRRTHKNQILYSMLQFCQIYISRNQLQLKPQPLINHFDKSCILKVEKNSFTSNQRIATGRISVLVRQNKCMANSMVNSAENRIGKPSSNSGLIYWIHFHTSPLRQGTNICFLLWVKQQGTPSSLALDGLQLKEKSIRQQEMTTIFPRESGKFINKNKFYGGQ